MQKLQAKLKNAPADTSQVRRSANMALNRDQSLGVPSIVLTCNNPEENLRLPVGGLKDNTLVYVLSKSGKPLMPCKPAKARHLLKKDRAKVVKRLPFTRGGLIQAIHPLNKVMGRFQSREAITA